MCACRPKTCQNTDDAGSCTATDYEKPGGAHRAICPAAAAGLTGALIRQGPRRRHAHGPGRPGSAHHLRAHLAAHPGRRAALVLVSDGLPQGCADNTVEAVAALLEAARTGSTVDLDLRHRRVR